MDAHNSQCQESLHSQGRKTRDVAKSKETKEEVETHIRTRWS